MFRVAIGLGVVIGLAWSSVAIADGIMLVPAGAFWMGRDEGEPAERPLHRVFVRDFWIERTKVTNAEFAEFLTAEGRLSPEGYGRFDHDDADARIHQAPGTPTRWVAAPGFESHPVVEVSWFGARDYCRWKGRRLPTEAEWEKAARGDDKRPYPWGSMPPSVELAVYGRRYNATESTGSRPAGRSPFGVHDLLGNLREWTASIWASYPYRPDDGRERFADGGPGPRARVVVRGASHDDAAGELSVTRRYAFDRRGASAGHHHIGFRCATSEDLGGR